MPRHPATPRILQTNALGMPSHESRAAVSTSTPRMIKFTSGVAGGLLKTRTSSQGSGSYCLGSVFVFLVQHECLRFKHTSVGTTVLAQPACCMVLKALMPGDEQLGTYLYTKLHEDSTTTYTGKQNCTHIHTRGDTPNNKQKSKHANKQTNKQTYIPTRKHTHAHIHAHTRTYTHTHTNTYIHTYIHRYIHTYVNTYIHTYTLTRAYTHKYIHEHACIHTYIHTLHTFHIHYYILYYITLRYIALIHTYIHTDIHTYIHKFILYIHACMHALHA